MRGSARGLVAQLRRWLLPVALAVLVLVDARFVAPEAFPEPIGLSILVLVVAALALGWRAHRPVPAAVVASMAVTSYLLLLHEDLSVQPAIEPFLVILVAMFSLGLYAEGTALPLGLTAAGLPLVVVELASLSAGRAPGETLPTLLFWATAFVLGRLVHRHRREAEHARAERTRVEEQAARRAAEAAAAERSRIAAELHDVVAHGLSAVVLNAGVERRLVADPSSSTWQVLDMIERTGRTSLTELRALLGLLERDDAGDLAPLPTLGDLEMLASPLRSAGHDVSIQVSGDPPASPDGHELSAYRIVQEALTNVLKHAPGAAVHVHVERSAGGVDVRVRNGPPTRPCQAVPGGGRGLVGMRERARVYAGSFDVDTLADGGFEVRAHLPRETS